MSWDNICSSLAPLLPAVEPPGVLFIPPPAVVWLRGVDFAVAAVAVAAVAEVALVILGLVAAVRIPIGRGTEEAVGIAPIAGEEYEEGC